MNHQRKSSSMQLHGLLVISGANLCEVGVAYSGIITGYNSQKFHYKVHKMYEEDHDH